MSMSVTLSSYIGDGALALGISHIVRQDSRSGHPCESAGFDVTIFGCLVVRSLKLCQIRLETPYRTRFGLG